MNEPATQAADAPRAVPAVRIERQDDTPSLVLDPDAPLEALRDAIQALFEEPDSEALDLRGKGVRLDFGRRDLALFDLRRLVHTLRDEHDVTVSGVFCTPEALHRYAEQELKLRVLLRDAVEPEVTPQPGDSADAAADADPAAEPDAAAEPTDDAAGASPVDAAEAADPEAASAASDDARDEGEEDDDLDAHESSNDDADEVAEGGRRVLAVARTLRSGARVRFPGDVVVYGDVNAGAHIEADGNIVVLGALRGLAHAGARGDEQAVIISFDLRPAQLRIGRRIAFPPEQDRGEGGRRLLSLLQRDRAPQRGFAPEIAHVRDGRIVLEDYRGRLPVGQRSP